MMQLARKEDFPAVVDIWQEGFGDTEEEITDFFTAFAEKARVCIWKEEGQIAGQLLLLPVLLCTPQGNISVEYIYAVATRKAYRNRGVCKKLLAAVDDMLKQEGKPAVLVPADKGLAAFYKRNGFVDGFTEEKVPVMVIRDAEGTAAGELRAAAFAEQKASHVHAADPTTYIALRKKAFAGTVHIAQPDEMLHFALSLKQKEGSRIAKVNYHGREYGILYREPANAVEPLLIEEIAAATTEEAIEVAQYFCGRLGVQQGVLQRSYETLWLGIPTGFSAVLSGKAFTQGYFNLVMD